MVLDRELFVFSRQRLLRDLKVRVFVVLFGQGAVVFPKSSWGVG